MAGPSAPLLDAAGKQAEELKLPPELFAAEVRAHLVHETVRAEAAAARAGTHAAKTRGLVAGGRSKPWRQKGTGRARAGTIRASQWTGGGVAFPPQPRSYRLKVNRKARKAAARAALSDHVARGTLAVVAGSSFPEPSTKSAAAFLASWGQEPPTLVIVEPEERALGRSFRNLDRVLVLEASAFEVGALVWARSVLVSEAALERVKEIVS